MTTKNYTAQDIADIASPHGGRVTAYSDDQAQIRVEFADHIHAGNFYDDMVTRRHIDGDSGADPSFDGVAHTSKVVIVTQ
jgi:hypothetical protein